jgi:glucose/arabinose dehydrogenase
VNRLALPVAFIGALLVALCVPAGDSLAAQLKLDLVANVSGPTALASDRGSPGRILITERRGQVRVLERGVLRRRPLLDIQSRVNSDAIEQGLLGIALPPDHARSRRFYIMFTRLDGDLVVEEWATRPRRPNLVDRSSRRQVIRIPRETGYANHNGGTLRFLGEKLFVSVGDGSNPGDILNRAQDPGSLRGKILRIVPRPDRKLQRPYRIPADNPFVGGLGRPEVFAVGLRNPHAMHFHRKPDGSREVTIYDVGQYRFEEVNHLPLRSLKGANFGWKAWEGLARYDCGSVCPNPTSEVPADPVFPVHTYGRDQGCAIIGGPVVRDRSLTGLTGRLLFSDFCTANFWQARPSTVGLDPVEQLALKVPGQTVPLVNAVNEDAKGRIFVLSNRNLVYRLRYAE